MTGRLLLSCECGFEVRRPFVDDPAVELRRNSAVPCVNCGQRLDAVQEDEGHSALERSYILGKVDGWDMCLEWVRRKLAESEDIRYARTKVAEQIAEAKKSRPN